MMIKHAGDVATIGPIIKDLIETSVKNDDQLVKLATIAQRIIAGEKKTEGQEGYLSAEEKAQLLAEIDSIQQEVSKVDDIQFEIEEIKGKIN